MNMNRTGGGAGPIHVHDLTPCRALRAAVIVLFVLALGDVAAAQTKVVRFGKLWDGTRVVKDAVVVVEGDRITRVGSGSGDLPKGAEVIDLRRYTGIPGLIDLHTHMTYYWDRQPGTRPLGQRRRPAVTVFLAQENARRTLETGVTTVRDLGASNESDFAMRDLIAMGAMTGPRMIVSGQGISAPRRPPQRSGRHAQGGRGADQGRVGLDQGLRLARQLRQRRHDADDHVRRDESHRRRRARAGAQGGDPLVRRVRRERRRPCRRRLDRARHRPRRRDDRRDGEARDRLGADDRSQSLLRRREGRVRLPARGDRRRCRTTSSATWNRRAAP